MGRVLHFELPASDPERAVDFYSKVFGWKFGKWEGPIEYWMVMTGPEGTPGINGGLLRRNDHVKGTTNTLAVDSVDATAKAVTAAGGKQVTSKMPIPGIGYFAYCEDTEGNLFGVMQADKAAK